MHFKFHLILIIVQTDPIFIKLSEDYPLNRKQPETIKGLKGIETSARTKNPCRINIDVFDASAKSYLLMLVSWNHIDKRIAIMERYYILNPNLIEIYNGKILNSN